MEKYILLLYILYVTVMLLTVPFLIIIATADQEIIISALSQSSFKRSSSILGINIRDTAALRQLSDDFIKSAVQRRRRPRRCPEYLICLLENPHNSRVACEGVCSNTRNN